MSSHLPAAHPLVRKLSSIFDLSEDEKAAVLRLPLQVVHLEADQDIVREGDRPSRSCAILEGFTYSYKTTAEGKRQILAFHLAGDTPDLQSLHLEVMDCSLATLTSAKLGYIPHDALRDLCARHWRIASVLWRTTLIDAAIFREWVTNLGRRDAYTRMTHLFCEWVVRLGAVGLVEDWTCELPMTQVELADAVGTSTVHVNRVLQDLRAAKLITLKGQTLTILDWERLSSVSGFDPTYLHLRREQRGEVPHAVHSPSTSDPVLR